MNVSTKRLLSILLSLAMVLAMLPMAVFAETATTLYVKPNANWIKDGARFAAYFFGNGEKWLDCTDADGDGYYEVEAPAGYPNVIFCRMNPGNKTNNWNNKWNQTSDLKVPADSKVCYVVAENTWDKGAGQWVEYTPEGGAGETEPTTASPIKYSVAGEAGLCGSAWTPDDINNMMLDEDGDGIYTITYTEIAAGSYKFKVTDGTWNNSWPAKDYVLKLEAKSNVTISFDTAAKAVKVETEALEAPVETEPTEPTPATYIVAGVAELCGSAWTPADTNNLMADEDGDGIYSITYTAIKAGTYQFKVTDGTWDNCWGGTAADGNYEFTLAADADVTINFNSADNSIEVVSDGFGEEPTEPTEPSEPFVPGVQEYALVGYINGADYGCNEDYENVGEYIFVDGTLTTSFTADSYIFIKTTDNANWYLSETYCSETTGTFVKNAQEKMFVPGNVELTFTLVENENGTLTLSYVTGEPVEPPVTEPTEPTEPSETEPSESEPVAATYYVAGSFNGWTNPDEKYVLAANEDGTFSITFAVTAGDIELKVTDGTWDNCWGDNGNNVKVTATADGEITVTFNPADGSVVVTGDILGGAEEPEMMTITSMHLVGDEGLTGANWDTIANQMSSGMGVYSITFENVAAGTYAFKFAANGSWDLNWASGIEITSGETQTAWFNAMGNSSITVAENGSTVTLSLDITGMDIFTGEGATMSATIETAAEPEDPEVPPVDPTNELVLGDNALALATGDVDGDSWTFTATEAGTVYINVAALAMDNGDGLMQDVPSEYIGMTMARQYTVLINGAPVFAYPAEVAVGAGDVVTVSISNGMGTATNLTLNLSLTAGEGGEDEPAAPGTMDNPIVIESMPFTVTVDGEHDLYYTYTAEADGVLTITYDAGNFVSGLVDYTKVDGVYYENVTAGQILNINPWGSNAGTYVMAYGEAPSFEDVSVYFDASLFAWTSVNAYAWDADGNAVGAEWPGVAMTQNEDGIWTVQISNKAAGILFNSGDYQTLDSDFAADTIYNGFASAIYGTELVTNFYVTGDGVFGEWASDNAAGIMTNNGDGTFSATIKNVEAGNYGFKVTDGTWDNSWGNWGENVNITVDALSDVTVKFNLNTTEVTYEIVAVEVEDPIVKPTLTLKSPTLEFKDMITVNAMFTAENIEDVVEMGMITYTEKVDEWNVQTAAHVIPGTAYDETTGRYIAHSQGINAKYLGDTVYLACYAKLSDGSYVYTKLAPYSPVQYATNQLKNSSDMKLKQLVAAMLNYGAQAQLFFGHNTDNLANATLTDEQKALPEAYRSEMVSAVPTASAEKQGIFANNKGFAKRYPSISFEGAFCINYFFKPNYAPVGDITLYYWNESDFNAAEVLTKENASGSLTLSLEDSGEYRGDIEGIAAKNLSASVFVAAVYSDGTTEWTSGVLGYSIGAYCGSQISKGADVAALAEATAVYGYHAKAYFG